MLSLSRPDMLARLAYFWIPSLCFIEGGFTETCIVVHYDDALADDIERANKKVMLIAMRNLSIDTCDYLQASPLPHSSKNIILTKTHCFSTYHLSLQTFSAL